MQGHAASTAQTVIPAEAGIQWFLSTSWIPASAGMTVKAQIARVQALKQQLTRIASMDPRHE